MEALSFGQWLSRQRKLLGLTQKQLAKQMNCATITVRKIEAEQRRPSPQVIERLTQVLNIPPDEKVHFLNFARGNISTASPAIIGNYPCHSTAQMIEPEMLAFLLDHFASDHNSAQDGRLILDETSQRVNLFSRMPSTRYDIKPDVPHPAASKSDGSNYVLLLVPIEIPRDLAMNLLHFYPLPEISGKSRWDA